jgi:hypothetical protein
MQDCFRKHPEIYSAELENIDDDEAPQVEGVDGEDPDKSLPKDTPVATTEKLSEGSAPTDIPQSRAGEAASLSSNAPKNAEEVMGPKKAFDATDANEKEDTTVNQPKQKKEGKVETESAKQA